MTKPRSGTLPSRRNTFAAAPSLKVSRLVSMPPRSRGFSGNPSRASRIAGCMLVRSGSRPYFAARYAKPAGSPGMPAASAVAVERPFTTSPCSSRNMSRVAAFGATSRASTIVSKPSEARCSSQKPPPPRPELLGSTTASAALTATAASNALPPCLRISIPASVASGWALAMPALPGRACAGVSAQTTSGRKNNATSSTRPRRRWNGNFMNEIPGQSGRELLLGATSRPGTLQGGFDRRMDELADVAAEARDLAHQRGGDEIELLRRREEHVVDLVGQVPVHGGDMELELEIRHR